MRGGAVADAGRRKTMKSFGETLKHVLDSRGMKPVELSRICGLNETYISRLINGKQKNPTFENGILMVRALGITSEEFYKLQEELDNGEE